ncbi:unnamed protein product, partial [Effrenium voratum]
MASGQMKRTGCVCMASRKAPAYLGAGCCQCEPRMAARSPASASRDRLPLQRDLARLQGYLAALSRDQRRAVAEMLSEELKAALIRQGEATRWREATTATKGVAKIAGLQTLPGLQPPKPCRPTAADPKPGRARARNGAVSAIR